MDEFSNYKIHYDDHVISKGTVMGSIAQWPGFWIGNVWPQTLNGEWVRTRQTVPLSTVAMSARWPLGLFRTGMQENQEHDEDRTGFRVSKAAWEIEDMGPQRNRHRGWLVRAEECQGTKAPATRSRSL